MAVQPGVIGLGLKAHRVADKIGHLIGVAAGGGVDNGAAFGPAKESSQQGLWEQHVVGTLRQAKI